jgi:hypothetical protein
MAAHLNINSLGYKFDEIKEVPTDNLVDLLIISETKLDESFNDNLFSVDGYKVQRRDRNQYGGHSTNFQMMLISIGIRLTVGQYI